MGATAGEWVVPEDVVAGDTILLGSAMVRVETVYPLAPWERGRSDRGDDPGSRPGEHVPALSGRSWGRRVAPGPAGLPGRVVGLGFGVTKGGGGAAVPSEDETMDEIELMLLDEPKYGADEESPAPSDRAVTTLGALEYNTALAKLMQGLKRDIGAKAIRQNYRGTGSKAHCRQLYVTLADDRVIDVWLNSGHAELGGVLRHTGMLRDVHYGAKTPEGIYRVIAARLDALTKGLPAVEG